jgi:hypothetical protein
MLEVYVGTDGRWVIPGVQEGETTDELRQFLRSSQSMVRIIHIPLIIDVDAMREARLEKRLEQIEKEEEWG